MKEIPILFSTPMVQAILEGRKTQTRRIVKNLNTEPPRGVYVSEDCFPVVDAKEGLFRLDWKTLFHGNQYHDGGFWTHTCPYGKVGDRLWVRETWGVGTRPDPHDGWVDGFEYKADKKFCDEIEGLPIYPVKDFDYSKYQDKKGWKPSIHMPRAAARIFLEITNVRVERVQDISEMDAIKEGVLLGDGGYWYDYEDDRNCFTNAKSSFKTLWRSINGTEAWESNPYVWVIEFKKVS